MGCLVGQVTMLGLLYIFSWSRILKLVKVYQMRICELYSPYENRRNLTLPYVSKVSFM